MTKFIQYSVLFLKVILGATRGGKAQKKVSLVVILTINDFPNSINKLMQ